MFYLFTGVSFSSKDAPVGAVRSAVAWVAARDQRAGGRPRVMATRPESLVERGEDPGQREQLACGSAVLLLEGKVRRVCCKRAAVRRRMRGGAGELYSVCAIRTTMSCSAVYRSNVTSISMVPYASSGGPRRERSWLAQAQMHAGSDGIRRCRHRSGLGGARPGR